MFTKQARVNVEPPRQDGRINTIIGEDVEIEGTIRTTGLIRIDGTLKGEGRCKGPVIIGESGRIQGNITAENVLVAGMVTGNLYVNERLEITETGKIFGDIAAKSLIISEGGILKGKSSMLDQGESFDIPDEKEMDSFDDAGKVRLDKDESDE